jgi:hypothetical protein
MLDWWLTVQRKTAASYIMSHSTSELTVIIIIIIVNFNLAFNLFSSFCCILMFIFNLYI